jgi:hypothetical protein
MADPTISKIFNQARAEGRLLLDEPSAKRILAFYGLLVPRGIRVLSDSDPLDGLTGPFVAKLISPDLVHKSDIGGVRLGLKDAAAAYTAVHDLRALAHTLGLRVDCILVEEMAPPGIEMVIGGIVDPNFGPTIMLGLGGVFVEILRDTVCRVCPITRRDAQEMIDELRGVALLRGARGREAADEAVIVAMLLAVAGERGLLVELENELTELDINPLIVSGKTAHACDARIVLASTSASSHV